MAKNPVKVTEEVPSDLAVMEEVPSELALDPGLDDFLLGNAKEQEANTPSTARIPRVMLPMPYKKYSNRGHKEGFVIDRMDGTEPEMNIPYLRVGQIDMVAMRTMWPFDPNTGKKLQGENIKPACASSDGISPRRGEVFNYIGNHFKDWRDGKDVEIFENGCAQCPLGQFMPVYNEMGEAVVERNYQGKMVAVRKPGPCAPTPTYVLWDFDRKTLLLFQAANWTVVAHMQGQQRGKWGALRGFDSYYKGIGDKRPDALPAPGIGYPVIISATMVENPGYGMLPAPSLNLGQELEVQELREWATHIQLYKSDNIRDIITGSAWFDFGTDELAAPQETADARPF